MKTERLHTRDVREDRSQREEKLASEPATLPGQLARDRGPAARKPKTSGGNRRAPEAKKPTAEVARAVLPVVVATRRAVAFRYTAPEAALVCVAGTFNNWNATDTPLARDDSGEWRVEKNLPPGEYEYRFVVDGVWEDDPAAARSVPNPFGGRNAVLSVG